MRPTYFFALAICTACLAPLMVRAADPQPYALTIPRTGNDLLDQTIAESSLLEALRTDAPAPPFALIERARGDVGRIEAVLNSFGYYAAHVEISIDGHDVDDPALPGVLDQVPSDNDVQVRVAIDQGPLYHLRNVRFDGDLPDGAKNMLELESGDPANASDILSGQARVLTALQEDGYAFARVDTPIAYLNDDDRTVDLLIPVTTGPQTVIGDISFEGLTDMNEAFVRQLLTIHPGDRYRPDSIEGARRSLAGLGVFSGVSVRAADHAEDDGSVPLTFDFQESPLHKVALSATYATDLGLSAAASWTHLNLFGNAEQLVVSVAATGMGGNATGGIGYTGSVKFTKPRFLGEDQRLDAEVSAVKQDFDAYSKTAQSIGVTVRRRLDPLWTAGAGLTGTHDEVTQQGITRLYELISIPLTAAYDGTGLSDTLADPTKGYRASFAVTPTLAVGTTDLTFVVLQAAGSAYFDLSGDGRTVAAVRAIAGSILGGSNFSVPPDQRFYAGGSATVRGFRYQSIGPHFPDGSPVGAASVAAGTIELRQRVGEDWGIAAFVDAGQASDNVLPLTGAFNVGVGAGARYYTSIGAIRADIAVPLTHVPDTDSFQIYIGLGQAF